MIEDLECRRLLSDSLDIYAGWLSAIKWERGQQTGIYVNVNYTPLAGYTLQLQYDDSGDSSGTPITASTDTDGVARFKNLRRGNYTLTAKALSAPFLNAKAVNQPLTIPFVPQFGNSILGYGPTRPAAYLNSDIQFTYTRDVPADNLLDGQVFFDRDRSGDHYDLDRNNGNVTSDGGVAGVRVYLDADRDGKRDKNEISVLTDVHGSIYFGGIPFAQMKSPMRISVPDGYWSTTANAITAQYGSSHLFGIFKPYASATIGFRTLLKIRDDLTPKGGYLVYLDLNRDAKWQRGEPRQATDAYGGASFKVLPGKYRLRVIAPPTFNVDRRYVDLKVGDRETRSRSFVLYGSQEYFVGFYFDADKDGTRDAGEPLLSRYPDSFLLLESKEYDWWADTFETYPVHRPVDGRGYLHLTNVPGTLRIGYEKYVATSSYPLVPYATIPASIATGGVWEIPIDYVPDAWYGLYPELAPFAP